MSKFSSQSRRSGFSLIEVAIALAIFVFGALAIVQIFPPALGVIRNNESRVTATQLGETLLARSTGKPGSLPDATYDANWNAGSGLWEWQDRSMAVVGTPSKNSSLPRSPLPSDFDNSALNRFKYIRREQQVVSQANGISFVLLNHPYTGWARIFREDVIQGVQISGKGELDFTHASNSQGIAFNDTATPRQAPAGETGNDVAYYVSYRWKDGSNIHGVIDEPLILPSGAWTGDAGKVARGLIDSSDSVLAGAVSVRYRHWVLSLVNTSYGERSYLELGSMTPGSTVSIDYSVNDWRNLVTDSGVSNFGPVSLPIKNLDPNVPPVGVFTFYIGATFDAQMLTPTVDYKKGEVTYPVVATQSKARARTIYRALDGWTQQLSVAAKSYIPFYVGTQFISGSRPASLLPREQWREYYWNGTSSLYFRASEAGKSVSVSFTDNNGVVVNDAILTIDDDLIDSPNAGFTAGRVSEAKLVNSAGVEVINPLSILSIKGLSVQARTAWQDGDRYTQTIVPGYRALMP